MTLDSGWAALLGTFVGGGITFGTTWWLAKRESDRISKNALMAAAGELEAGVEIADLRGWRADFVAAAESARAGVVYSVSIFVPDEPLPFCRAAASKDVDLDPEMSVALSRAIASVTGLFADLRRLAEYGVDGDKSLLHGTQPERAAEVYDSMVHLYDSARVNALTFVSLVRKKHGKP